MINKKNILAAVLASAMLAASAAPILAQDNATPAPTAGNAATPPSQPGTAPQSTSPGTGSTTPGTGGGAGNTTANSPSANNAQQGAVSGSPAAPPPAPAQAEIETQPWSFAGVFGRYDQNQLRRGFQVFKEVCSNCHSAHLFSFRNLEEPGGPDYSDAQVKALAATYKVADPDAPGGERPALASDRWPSPFATEKDARDANGGALPPDFSVLAKARSAERPFPWWLFDYFTTYQEGGPDYIHALLNGFHDEPPAGFNLPPGKYYNDYFPGHAIGMPPPLSDGLVAYQAGPNGEKVPETVDQYSRDVSAFMMWRAEPGLDARKEAGFRVIMFLFLFAVLMWMVKRRIWANVEH
jgi:ubiquinol-cytochrome c reductase cytochrome c1 subunit